jgi:hypothetical protein
MNYKLGDIITVKGISGTIAYINNNLAWIKPHHLNPNIEVNFQGKKLITGVVFAKLDRNGRVVQESPTDKIINAIRTS